MTCRRWLKGASGQKYVSMTSRQTNASSGKVANMLAPNCSRSLVSHRFLAAGERETHASPCEVDERVVLGKVVEDVALRAVREDEVARGAHTEAREDGKRGGDVGHAGEAVDRRRAERAVDEHCRGGSVRAGPGEGAAHESCGDTEGKY